MSEIKIAPLDEALEEIEKAKNIIAKDGENTAQKWTPEPITPDMLPPSIRAWVNDVCERIESPFEIGAVSALCFIGNLIGSKVGIRPKQFDSWTVTPNLWGMIIGRPSIKKTPVYSELYKSIGRLQKQAETDHAKDFEVYEIESELHAIKWKEATKAGDEEALKKLKEETPKKPKKRRYVTQDGTIEAITDIIKENPNGLLVSRDELSGWLKQMDRAGREGERAFYLEGWNGTNSFSVDRIGRGGTFLPRLTLGVIGNIQPSIVKEYVYEAVRDKKADGFLQRFQMAVYAEPIEQKLIDRAPNRTTRDQFDEVINYAARDDEFAGAVNDDFSEIPFYRFNDEAQSVFNKWYLSNDKEAKEAFNEALEGHLNKYPKLFASLALVFHICDIAAGRSFDHTKIDKRNAQRALELTNALKSHAYRLYSTFEIEEQKRDAATDKIMLFLADKELPVKFQTVTQKAGGKPTKTEIMAAIKGHYSFSGSNIVRRLY